MAAAIGCEIDHCADELRLSQPALPRFLGDLTIRNLEFGNSRLDLHLSRAEDDVTTAVVRRSGPARVTISK